MDSFASQVASEAEGDAGIGTERVAAGAQLGMVQRKVQQGGSLAAWVVGAGVAWLALLQSAPTN